MAYKSFTFRIPDELRKELEAIAKKDGRTLSNLILKILTDYINNQRKERK